MKPSVRIFIAAASSLLLFSACPAQSGAPPEAYAFRMAGTPEAPPPHRPPAFLGDDKSDAGYSLYKDGYSLILEEKYAAARKKFEELLEKHPKSSYADDARYWTAYSYRNSDRKKAMQEYTRFIKEHPKSTYCDDAVADMASMEDPALPPLPATGTVSIAPFARPGFPPIPPRAPNAQNLMRELKRQMRQIGRMGAFSVGHASFARGPEEEKLDDPTRIKMDALYALGETKEDDKSFSTLRDVALDTRQVRPLREAAMDALSSFTQHDVLSMFVDIARQDTSADIQGYAIDYVGEHGADKNQRVSTLESLYRTLPKTRTEQRKTIVYTIAGIGNDRAVDFLRKVALNDESIDFRRDAVYYLGSIGGESARSALYEILKGQ